MVEVGKVAEPAECGTDRPLRARIIACETVGRSLRELAPPDMPLKSLEFGLHQWPEQLNAELQKAIDETEGVFDTVLLGYGMCSKGTLGLVSRHCRLVIPRVDDCIGLFLGSRDEYRRRSFQEPGTFYLTGGWIECGDDPYTEYLKMRAKYGHDKALRLERRVIESYKRIALVNSGESDIERYRAYARHVASFFGLEFLEIEGSNDLIRRMVAGEWDKDFVVVEPGQKVEYYMFR